ncbi:MAG: hypothetical protein E6I66_01815 [Chloroflexi bacterium]|nr:MAG: hypothetical protein E6I66_01815 [Chloroflexota bacterium]
MRKLALAIGFASYIVFGASSGSLAAYRVDNTAGDAANRDSRIAWSETGTNARLLFLNEALYSETTVASGATSPGAHGDQERADMARPDTSRPDTERMFCEGDICLVP